jgi:hypothetical protein
MPPAILNAGSVMPNILKIKLPASANEHSTIAQVIAERRATAWRSSLGELAVTAKNMGITANGSTKKNTEVSASNANSRTEVIVGIEVGHAPRAQDRPTTKPTTSQPVQSSIFALGMIRNFARP